MEKERGIVMSKRDIFKFETIEKYISGQITRLDAATFLGVDKRTISRLKKRVIDKGILGVKHGNLGKRPLNRHSDRIEAHVKKMIRLHYFDRNMTHIHETLVDHHGIHVPYATIYKWCHEIGVVKRRRRKGNQGYRSKRSRMPQTGFMLQMDGSPHWYTPNEQWVLIAAIDDATNEIAGAQFYHSETTFNCMDIMRTVIESRGIPYSVYVDRAGWLGGSKRANFGDFRRACEDLGVQVIFANSPQAKGRIERWFQVPQDRLTAELRSHNITDIAKANEYLKTQFIEEYWNATKTVLPKNPETRYQPLTPELNLKEIFTQREYRKINNDYTFKWQNKTYQIINPPGDIRNQDVELRFYPSGESAAYFAERKLEVTLAQDSVKLKAA